MKLLLLLLFFGLRASAECLPKKIPTTTCDFDVSSDEYLSEACVQIKNQGGELFEKAKEETTSFNKFYEKLQEFENKFKDINDTVDLKNYDMWNARTELYKKTLLLECHCNKTGVKFYDCLIDKREKMIVELNKLIAKKISGDA